MSNPVFEAVRTVLAVREYQDRPIPDDVMGRIVEAGHLSASASNVQPWHFVVVRDRAGLRDLGGLVAHGPYVSGVGSNWTGFGELEGVREKVGLPDKYEVLAVVPFGYPRREIGKGKKKRKP